MFLLLLLKRDVCMTFCLILNKLKQCQCVCGSVSVFVSVLDATVWVKSWVCCSQRSFWQCVEVKLRFDQLFCQPTTRLPALVEKKSYFIKATQQSWHALSIPGAGMWRRFMLQLWIWWVHWCLFAGSLLCRCASEEESCDRERLQPQKRAYG